MTTLIRHARAGGPTVRRSRQPWRDPSILLAVATALVAHLLFLSTTLGADEGGFAMVARFRNLPGGHLYGPQWVDRPPGLIAVFAFADHLGRYGVRIVATVVAVVLVVAVAWAAHVLDGRTAGRWGAWTAAGLASSVLISAQQLNGELIAAALVALSIAATVTALRRTGRVATGLAVLAGAAAVAAPLVKQNFLDALAFAGVIVLARRLRSGERLGRSIVVPFALGALVPLVATLLWSRAHGGIGALAYAVVGFRLDAESVMAHWSTSASDHRAVHLLVQAASSGVLLIAIYLVSVAIRRRRVGETALALGAAGAVEVVGVVGGGNFWSHYLIALVPTLSIAAGIAAGHHVPGSRTLRVLVCVVVLSTVVVSPWYAVRVHHRPGAAATIARWIRSAAHPRDTIVVPSSNPNIIDESGLRPVYPYAWSLPVRTLDPHLTLLRRTLAGRRAPTWVVQWNADDTWGLDPHARVPAVLTAHYRLAGTVCGRKVWLHDGVSRRPAAVPPVSECRSPHLHVTG